MVNASGEGGVDPLAGFDQALNGVDGLLHQRLLFLGQVDLDDFLEL